MLLVQSIAARLQESKNIGLNPSFQKGLWAELQAAKYLVKSSHILLAHRAELPVAEVDLISQTPNGEIVITEVKTMGHLGFQAVRIRSAQIRRLKGVTTWLQSRSGREVYLQFIFVDRMGKVSVLDTL